LSRSGVVRIRRLAVLGLALIAALTGFWLIATQPSTGHPAGHLWPGRSPYTVPNVVDTNPNPRIVETTLTAEYANVNIGNGVIAHAETFNGTIPGPTFRLKVGDTVIVHLVNHLKVGTGIHWHGIELPNEMDGTPFTQDYVPPGGKFIYKFTVTRPGIFWYHPHHDPPGDSNTNQVFSGLYGMIIVTDPNDAKLIRRGTLPPASQTRQLVLSDTTVCKAPGSNDSVTYPNPGGDTLPWVGNPNGGTTPALPVQPPPTPKTLCETPTAIDGSGNTRATSYAAGDIPSIQQNIGARSNEGQTVLTNGINVGARAGSPSSPGALAPGASTLNVRPGQGLRLQMVNASAVRFFRLRLTTSTGEMIPLIRVGGEGGLLDYAVEEGGTQQTWVTGYDYGEILLPPGSRADVVAAIPSSATGVATIWTEDYQRTGMGYSDIPTVPVMHLNVTGRPVVPAYTIQAGTPLRDATGDPVEKLGPATGQLLDPSTFNPPQPGMANPNITFTVGPQNGQIGINNVTASHDIPDYRTAEHPASARWAYPGEILQLQITNTTNADHPFHLHGFSIQPIELSNANGSQKYVWPYPEFRDNIDIPPGFSLTFRVRIDPRPQMDGHTPGGELGRWLFHCHIFFHATLGMLSELVVVPKDGMERPDINVNTTQVNVRRGQIAIATGSYFEPNSEPVRLTASIGSMHKIGGGNFIWTLRVRRFGLFRPRSQWVYVTATNADGSTGQALFFLNIRNRRLFFSPVRSVRWAALSARDLHV
jgi:FtsP/CotA-like multicopper oxidase with cupredoxin domain